MDAQMTLEPLRKMAPPGPAEPAKIRLSLSPGEVVAGRYRVERALGAGGMGSVLAAHDLSMNRPVAIKHLLPVHAGNREAHTRFAREARVTAWIRSEHVARVLDAGEIPSPTGGAGDTYLVMERLEGRDLRTLVRESGPLPVDEAVDYVRQACAGMAEAHALGIVHRDLKPANLFRVERPSGQAVIKILDFGIAKFSSPNVAGDDIEMTEPSTMIGSRPFMSPEQMLDAKEADARADVWALGTILFYLLTGCSPFEGDSSSDLAFNILQSDPRPLADLRPDAPPGLDAVIRRCVEKLRDRRFANVVDLWRALAPFARPTPSTTPKLGTETTELPVVAIWPPPSSSPDETLTIVRRPRRHGPTLAAAAVAAALTLAASAVVFTEGPRSGVRYPHTPPPPPPPPPSGWLLETSGLP